MSFEITQGAYAGPFPVLLELLENRKLAISDISLARIAGDFAQYIDTHTVPNEELADFLLISSRLIYLKTKELLPYLELPEEDQGVDLAEQMRIYQHFVSYAEKLADYYTGPAQAFSRPFDKRLLERSFASPVLRMDDLHEAFARVMKRNEPFFLLKEASMERIESVKERIERMTTMIQAKARFGFKELTSGAQSKADIVVSFLALLELLKSRVIRATQHDEHDIIIERI